MRFLYLLRHAKSSWSDPTLADRERPLAPRGRRDAGRVAAHLAAAGIRPVLVLCSAAVRTRETLEALRPALGPAAEVRLEPGLYAASAGELLSRLQAVPADVDSVMVIGHNPGLHDLALALASGGSELERLEQKFPTAALATLVLPRGTWAQLSDGGAVLAAYVVPKQLG